MSQLGGESERILDLEGKGKESIPKIDPDPEQSSRKTDQDITKVDNATEAAIAQSKITETDKVRKSTRQRTLTEKAQQNLNDDKDKKSKRFYSCYEQWRKCARAARERLREPTSLMELNELSKSMQQSFETVVHCYNEVKKFGAPQPELVARVDNCVSISHELLKNLEQRRLETPEEFDAVHERRQAKELKTAHPSVFGGSVSEQSSVISGATRSSVTSQRIHAEAEKATKLEEIRALQEEQSLRTNLLKLQLQMEEEKMKLETIRAKAAARVAEIRCEVYEERADSESKLESNLLEQVVELNPKATSFIPAGQQNMKEKTVEVNSSNIIPYDRACGSPAVNDFTEVANLLSTSMQLNRLPTPVPIVFNGNPFQFLEFKQSFNTLIDNKGISTAEKMYYLNHYVTGKAKDAIEGFLLGTTEEAYIGAWQTLEERFGHPFNIQQAFRSRLEKWPKIGAKDAEGLQKFADFLKCCQDARPFVKGLSILDDCYENQKLLSKLPEWLVMRWNRTVTCTLEEHGSYPTFQTFVAFVKKEARIASNPISSLNALKVTDEGKHKEHFKKHEGNKRSSTLATKAKEDIKTKYSTEMRHTKEDRMKTKVIRTCWLCSDGEHFLDRCPMFKAKQLDERKSCLKENRICYGCLKKGHRKMDCRNRRKCEICYKYHPTLLHDSQYSQQAQTSKVDTVKQTEPCETSVISCKTNTNMASSTSMIVPVWVSGNESSDTEILTYALLDTQSDSSFILEELAQKLNTEVHPVRLKLSTITSSSTVHCGVVLNLSVRGLNLPTRVAVKKCYTRDVMPVDKDHIPTKATASKWQHLDHLTCEMPELQECEVGMLIGYDCSHALAPKQTVVGKSDEPFAIQTELGWSIVGSGSRSNIYDSTFCHRVLSKEVPYLSPNEVLAVLESDFSEKTVDDKVYSQHDIAFLQCLENNIRRTEDGHLEMPLPFKQRPSLPNNYKLVNTRLKHLQRKLNKDDQYQKHYRAFMKEIIDLGYAEKVNNAAQRYGEVNYIPHHGVYHPKKNKIRVVFDCSAKFCGTSLNEHLYKGPDLTNTLIGVLLRFREHDVALTCDIEKMFYQFKVREEDRDYLRFLWWNNDCDTEPVQYRMTVHLFGAASSPGCANYGLKYLADKYKSEFPEGSRFLRSNFYVDDGLISVPSCEDGMRVAEESIAICKMAGIRLHKFLSNEKAALKDVPPSERAVEAESVDLDKAPMERVLGILWNTVDDTFKFEVSLKDKPATRRGILSVVAAVYDPLGLVAPVVLTGKKILQEMCRRKLAWDDPADADMKARWEHWCQDLINLKGILIRRCYHPLRFGKITKAELHHFSDASVTAYGQCSYLRLMNRKGEISCHLVFAKSRVAPTKVVTIPRLELNAAALSVKVSSLLKEELQYEDIQEFFWTDSQVVLGYINNEARQFHTFVANRVQFIRERSSTTQWKYVPSEQNPADHASRGLTVEQLRRSNWLEGPSFLWKSELILEEMQPKLQVGDPEVKALICVTKTKEARNSLVDRLNRFSSWSLMVRVVARLKRLLNRREQKSLIQQRQEAEKVIIRSLQEKAFSEEIQALNQNQQVKKTSPIQDLNPFMDSDGLLRVGGRLRRCTLSDDIKHPVILPKISHVSNVMVKYFHERIHHQGRGQTLNHVRSNGYWIISGSRVVANVIKNCVTCRRLRRPVEEQKMADLPADRVEASSPFTFVGMDCFGPFMTKRGRTEVKRYGLLFTCLCSRGIHIEMLDDLSTDAFINGLRCFLAIRGAVKQIRCDQGGNFVGARNELQAAEAEMDSERIGLYLADHHCDFIFNAPSSSHAGGIWERQIRTVRAILNVTVNQCHGRLDDSSLRTLFYEAMAIVNSRPLAPCSLTDPIIEPLTPNHLITMKSSTVGPPPGTFVKEDMYAKKRWRRVQYLVEQFWSRWRKEYMLNLQQRNKWKVPRRNLRAGDVVILKDQESQRNDWPLGIITRTTLDEDGLVRRVWVRVGSRELDQKGRPLKKISELERPIQKLVVLVESV